MKFGDLLVLLFVISLAVGVAAVANGYLSPYPLIALVLAVMLNVLVTSVYIIPNNRYLVSFLISTHRATYLSGTTAKRRDVQGTRFIDYVDEDGKPIAFRGLLGFDVVILLYPIWRVRLAPVTENVGIVHVARTYTKDEVPTLVDVTLTWGLSPDLGPFMQTFPVLDGPYDLGKVCWIRDNLWDPEDPKRYLHEYEGSELARIVMGVINNDVQHKVRTAGASYYWTGTPNIKSDKKDFEQEFKDDLCKEKNAAIRRGEMLVPDAAGHAVPGRSVASLDVNFEDVDVQDSDVRKALGLPLIAAMEAQADAKRGEGRGEHYKNLAKKSKIPAREARLADMVEKSEGALNIGLLDGAKNVLRQVGGLIGVPPTKPTKTKTTKKKGP